MQKGTGRPAPTNVTTPDWLDICSCNVRMVNCDRSMDKLGTLRPQPVKRGHGHCCPRESRSRRLFVEHNERFNDPGCRIVTRQTKPLQDLPHVAAQPRDSIGVLIDRTSIRSRPAE